MNVNVASNKSKDVPSVKLESEYIDVLVLQAPGLFTYYLTLKGNSMDYIYMIGIFIRLMKYHTFLDDEIEAIGTKDI